MRESSTYQKILADGRIDGLIEGEEIGMVKGERDALFRIASRRLGEPDKTMREIVERATLSRIQAWIDKVIEVESWQELLAS